MPPINAPKSARLLEQIELELKRLYRLQPLAPDKFIDMGAFGTNTMTFEQWLQFVPAVKEALAGDERHRQKARWAVMLSNVLTVMQMRVTSRI